MRCPHCQVNRNSSVLETRDTAGRLRRRRRCDSCSGKFTTLEVVVGDDERSWHGSKVVIFTEAQAKAWREAMLGMADVLSIGVAIEEEGSG